jgi:hypothetical protein
MTKLRPTQAEIIAMVADGDTNQQIADRCGITVRTMCRDRAKHPEFNAAIIAARRAFTQAHPLAHGIRSRYNKGCRCDECREANRVGNYELTLQRRQRAGMPPPDPRYGPRRGPRQRRRIERAADATYAVLIAQRIARGCLIKEIMDALGVTYEQVKSVRDQLAEAAAS